MRSTNITLCGILVCYLSEDVNSNSLGSYLFVVVGWEAHLYTYLQWSLKLSLLSEYYTKIGYGHKKS